MAKKIKPPRDKEAEKKAEEAEKVAEDAKKAEEAAKAAETVQDEFQARGFELVEWVQENRPAVLGFIGVVLAGGLAFGIYTASSRSNDTKASAAYGKALKLEDASIGEDEDKDDDVPAFKDAAERNKAARDAYVKVAAEHKGTGAGALASLSAAQTSLKLGEFDAAIGQFDTFLKATKPTDPLRFAGLSGLAAAKDAKGDTKGAIEALEDQVTLKDKTDKDGALLALGQLYAREGDTEKARARLEKLIADFPESSLKAKAEEQLGALGGLKKPDVKVDDAKKDAPK